MLLTVIALTNFPLLKGQTLEGGFHTDFSIIGADGPLGTEKGTGFGLWALYWPISNKHFALCADWAKIYRDEYITLIPAPGGGSFRVGETERNRQYVDATLQFYLKSAGKTNFFVEAGGGALWNNSQVVNPNGVPYLLAARPSARAKRHVQLRWRSPQVDHSPPELGRGKRSTTTWLETPGTAAASSPAWWSASEQGRHQHISLPNTLMRVRHPRAPHKTLRLRY